MYCLHTRTLTKSLGRRNCLRRLERLMRCGDHSLAQFQMLIAIDMYYLLSLSAIFTRAGRSLAVSVNYDAPDSGGCISGVPRCIWRTPFLCHSAHACVSCATRTSWLLHWPICWRRDLQTSVHVLSYHRSFPMTLKRQFTTSMERPG